MKRGGHRGFVWIIMLIVFVNIFIAKHRAIRMPPVPATPEMERNYYPPVYVPPPRHDRPADRKDDRYQ